MIKDTMTSPIEATLTQKELFERFLDAPYYKRAISPLVDEPRLSEFTVRENQHNYFGLGSMIWPELPGYIDGIQEFLILNLCELDEPEDEIDQLVYDLQQMLKGMEILQQGFSALCAATRTERPKENASGETHRVWDGSPQYVLPERPNNIPFK